MALQYSNSFETGIGTWNVNGEITMSQSSAVAKTGTYSLKAVVANTSGADYARHYFSSYISTTYEVRAEYWFRASVLDSADDDVRFSFLLDSSGTEESLGVIFKRKSTPNINREMHIVYSQGTSIVSDNDTNITMATDTWYRFECTFDGASSPVAIYNSAGTVLYSTTINLSSVTEIRGFYIQSDTGVNNCTFYIDDVLIERADIFPVATVTIDHTKVPADLTDYVAYINLADMPTSFWSTVANGGGDIRCYKSDGTTELAREVVSCDTATQTGELHIKYSGTLSSSTDTVIKIYADGLSSDYPVTGTYGRNAVWSGAYNLVSHDGGVTNSTSTSYSITNNGASSVTGLVGTASSFNGTNDYVTVASNAALQLSTYTFSLLIKANVAGGGTDAIRQIINKSTNTFSEANYSFASTHTSLDFTKSSIHRTTTEVWVPSKIASTMSADTFYYVSSTYNGTSIKVFLNGSLENTVTAATPKTGTTGALFIGSGQSNGTAASFFGGLIDEVRIGSGAKSDDWLETESNNLMSASTFYTITGISTFTPYVMLI
jgi:hypothetical protein